MSGWLDRRPTWQFALISGASAVAACLLGDGIGTWVSGHRISYAFLIVYTPVFTIETTAIATARRHRRLGSK
jgi:hypothetical protein